MAFPLISSPRTRFLENLGHLTLSYSGQYGLAVTDYFQDLRLFLKISLNKDNLFLNIKIIRPINPEYGNIEIKAYFRNPFKTSTIASFNLDNTDNILPESYDLNYCYKMHDLERWNEDGTIGFFVEIVLIDDHDKCKYLFPLYIQHKDVVSV